MTRRAVRLVLLLLLVAGVTAAAYVIVLGERRMSAALARAREFDHVAVRARQSVNDVRSAQQAYVAIAQSTAWWRAKADGGLASLDDDLEVLRRLATDRAALEAIDAASAAAAALGNADRHVGRLLAENRAEQASALIFGEALAAAAAAARHIESARLAYWMAADRGQAEQRRAAASAAASAAGLSLLVALLLAHGGRRAAAPEPARAPAPSEGQSEPVAASRTATTRAQPEPVGLTLGESAPASDDRARSAGRDRRRAPELSATADLCTDFARLMDSQELPALLERAARLLDATGLIVWVSEAGGTELRPILAHGYSAQALSRLPAIPREADNATAAAFRRSQMEIVKTNGMSPGAIAAPLLTASGCVGIMAAEVRHGREASESARALARIVAAQLATLLSVTPAEANASPRVESVAG